MLKFNENNIEPGHENFGTNRSRINGVLNTVDKYEHTYNTELAHFAYGYPDWIHQYHHAGFDIVANRILEIVDEYLNISDVDDMNGNVCYWVTGHSMGAGVANIVAAELLHGSSGINDQTDNVYCYTFASPNTFYITDNVNVRRNYALPDEEVTETYREPKTTKYRCIFNIVNSDDFVPRLPMKDCNWTKYGRIAEISFNDKVKSKRDAAFVSYYYSHYTTDYQSKLNLYSYIKYIGTKEISQKISDDLSGIYDDLGIMRSITYDGDNMNILKSNGFTIALNKLQLYNRYALPYQKIITLNGEKVQLIMPAYFMHLIAGALHENNLSGGHRWFPILNGAQIMLWPLSYRCNIARNTIIHNKDNIQTPHYPESYYKLTKVISVTDFN